MFRPSFEKSRAGERLTFSPSERDVRTSMKRSLPILGAGDGSARPSPRSVRISLTDRCDLACVYCRPSRNDEKLPERLSWEALASVIEGLFQAGIRRMRFTGGEPLLSPHAVRAVGLAQSIGADDIALTTNGTRLAELAAPLRAAGLRRLTLSLDSLDEARFARLTRGGKLARVLGGLEAARRIGFDEIKLNAVVLRGENDSELEAITLFAWRLGLVPRFIEVMPIAEGAKLVPDRLVSAREMRDRLAHLLSPDEAVRDPERGPAKYVASRHDPGLRVGFITGTTDTYCESCDRLRISAAGVVRPCLASDAGVALESTQEAVAPDVLSAAVERAWAQKPDGKRFRGCTDPGAARLSMRAIGG
jgi:cyclic pyranopterin phosphate synthase